MTTRLCLLLALINLGCGGAEPHVALATASETPAPEPLCRFDGAWTTGVLRTARGGFVFASVFEGEVRAALGRDGDPRRLDVEVEQDGWTLVGRVDPQGDNALRVSAPTGLHEGVGVAAGAVVSVLDARPGEARVGLSPRDRHDAVRFVAPIERWVGCDALGFAFTVRDSDASRQDRVAFGLPAEPRTVVLAPAQRAELAVTPGGAPFAEILPREEAMELYAIEERAPYTRVLHQHRNALVVGWTASNALTVPDDDDAEGGYILGALGGSEGRTFTVCKSTERLAFSAAQGEGEAEPAGFIEPGTRFVRGEPRGEGVITIEPHPSASVYLPGEDIVWLVAPRAPLQCVEETHDPMRAFHDALAGEPDPSSVQPSTE